MKFRSLSAALLLTHALTGCGPESLPLPRVLEISPASMEAPDSVTAIIAVDAVLPAHSDFGNSSTAVDRSLTVSIGKILMSTAEYPEGGRVLLPIPSVFEPGVYDVAVRLADGREGRLSQGFSVTPGRWPNGYSFDFISPQVRDVPFAITVRAEGPSARFFRGTVSLKADRGKVTPSTLGPFVAGIVTGTVTLTALGHDKIVTLTVTDAEGHEATSNPISVR